MRISPVFLSFLALSASVLSAAPGDLDAPFMATVGTGFSEPINAVAVHPDGTILAGGNLGQFQGANDGVLWRLNPDGSLHSVVGPFADSAGDPEVDAIRIQADGKILVGGVFTSFDGNARSGIVRLNSDGSFDPTFVANGVNGTLRYVNDIEVQPDGKIILAGGFTTVNSTFRMSVARLNADGSLDTGFVPPTFHTRTDFGTFATSVDDVDLQPDGRLVLAGAFNLINSTLSQGGAARLHADGSLDLSFAVGAGAEFRLNHCKVMPDGGVLFGGLEATYQGVPVQGLFKVDANGALDSAFNGNLPAINGWLGGDVILLPNGQILACGIFNDIGGDDVSSIVRLNADGTRDLTFDNTPYTTDRGQYGTHMYSIAVQPDGKIVVGGWMNDDDGIAGTGLGIQINGTKIYNLVRFEGDYSPGPGNLAFTTPAFLVAENGGSAIISVTRYGGVTGAVSVELSTGDGSALAGSDYTATTGTLSWADGEGGERTILIPITDDEVVETEEGLILTLSGVTGGATIATPLSALGILDDDSPPVILADPIDLTLIQGNSGMLVVAAWSVTPMTYQWRKDGVDIPWGTMPWLLLSTVDEDDAGEYTVVITNANGAVTSAPATVTVEVPPGSLDPSFLSRIPDTTLTGHAPDGSGGWFGVTTFKLYHLLADGSLDPDFTMPEFLAGASAASLYAIASAGDGTFLVGGSFTQVGGATIHRLVRLLGDGSVDPSFTSPFGVSAQPVRTIRVGPDGAIYVGFYNGGGLVKLLPDGTIDTSFTADATIGTGVNGSISEILVQSDGKLLVCHLEQRGFGDLRYRFSRLNPDGSLDPTFTEPALSWTAEGVDLLPDGRIALGGRFVSINGVDRIRLAILHPDGTLDTSFDPGAGLSHPVWAVRFHAGRIMVGGEFTTASGVTMPRIASYRLDGTLDPDFNPGAGPSGKVEEILVDAAGRLVLAGQFFTYNGITTRGIARLVPGPSAVGFLTPQATAFETDGTVTVTVARYGETDEPLSIDWATTDGSAAAPGDYIAAAGTLSWAAGESGAKAIVLSLVDDATLDGDLSFSLVLGAASVGSVFADTVTVLIKDDDSLPRIAEQPAAVQTVLGFGGTFSVVATSPTAVTYQWYKDGVALAGRTDASLAISAAAEADAGSYRVLLANDYGSVWSAAASLVLVPDPSLLVSGFNPSVTIDSGVVALAVAPDGGAYVGGQFINAGGNPALDYLLKLKADGTLDPSFTPPALDGWVYDIVVQEDGRLLVVGAFRTVGGVAQRGLVRLEPNGAIDLDFAANVGEGANGNVWAVDVFAGGSIVVGGSFSSWKGTSLSPYRDLILLNPDGSFNASYFKTSGTATILDVKTLPDGGVLVSHDTTSSSAAKVTRFRPDRITDTDFTFSSGRKKVERIALAADGDYLFAGVESLKVNPDGTTDTLLSTTSSGRDIVEQRNGKVFLGGSFSGNLKRYLPGGTEDPTFAPSPNFNGWVYRLGLRPDGKVWVAGSFNSYLGQTVSRVALINGDAIPLAITRQPKSLITDPGEEVVFSIEATGLTAIAYQWYRDGAPLADGGGVSGAKTATLTLSAVTAAEAGEYTCTATNEAGTETSAGARLRVLGAPEFLSLSEGLTQLAGGTVELAAEVIGAGELSYEWRRNGVALAEGGPYTGVSTSTFTIAPAGVGASGTYTLAVTNTLGTTVSSGIVVTIEPNAAAIADGFTPLTSAGTIYAILVLGDGRALVGGTVGPLTDGAAVSGNYLAVVNPDGSIDTSVSLSANGNVRTLVWDSAGRILVGGAFSQVNGVARSKVARLKADLSLDETFDPGAGADFNFGEVYAVLEDADGRIYLGGSFFGWSGVAGTAYLARIGPNGAVDNTFAPASNSYVFDLGLASDGDLFVSGYFASIGGGSRSFLARLSPGGTLDPDYAPAVIGVYGDELHVFPDDSVFLATQIASRLNRFNADGTTDAEWVSHRFDSQVRALAFDASGGFYAGGTFFNLDGSPARRIARVLADGSVDGSFDSGEGFNNDVEAIALAPDGSVWVGGAFATYNGVAAPGLVRLAGSALPGPSGVTFADYAAGLTFPAGLEGASADANRNGLPNLLDFLLGLDATDPASVLDHRPSFATGESLGLAGDSALYLTFQISVRADAIGLDWGVTMSSNLLFDENSLAAVVVGEPVEAEGMLTYTFRAPWSLESGSAVFYRLWGELTP